MLITALIKIARRERARTTTAKNTLLLRYITLVIAIVTGVFMVPLYIKYIPTGLYGFWLASGYFLVLLNTFDPGLSTVLQQRIAEAYGKRDMKSVGSIVRHGLAIALVISGILLVAGLLLSLGVPSIIGVKSTNEAESISEAFRIGVAGTSLAIFAYAICAINQGLQSNWTVGLAGIVVNVTSTALCLYLLLSGATLRALAWPLLYSGVSHVTFQGLYLTLRLWAEGVQLTRKPQEMRELTKLLSWTAFGRAAALASNNIDSLVVCRLLEPSLLISLSINRKASDYCREFVNQIIVSFMPALSHLKGSGDHVKMREIVVRLTRINLWILSLVCSGFILFNQPFVSLWVNADMFLGQNMTALLGVGLACAVAGGGLQGLNLALGNIKVVSIVSGAQSFLHVVLTVALTKQMGITGAALAPIFAVLAGPLIYNMFCAWKTLLLPFDYAYGVIREVLVAVIAASISYIIVSPIRIETWIEFLCATGLFVLLFCALGALLSKALRAEITMFWSKLGSRLILPRA